jgi:predicted alpha/beta superfamily hydrolase
MIMKTARPVLIIFITLCIHIQMFSHTTGLTEDPKPLTLERTVVKTIHSEIVGQDFELLISLPKSYGVRDTVFPVMILLDPYRAFLIMKGFTDVLTNPYNYIPEVIIVGVGYGGTGMEAMMNWALGRTRDMSPEKSIQTEDLYRRRLERFGVPDMEVKTGGAPLFLDFIKTELLPFVESNYRIDDNLRILSGYSMGGLFAMYTLFHEPGLFHKYLIGSPSIHFNDGVTFDYESAYAREHSDLQADVFLSAGSLEGRTVTYVEKMADLLTSRNYEHLDLYMTIFEKETHVSCYMVALSRGILELLGNTGTDP